MSKKKTKVYSRVFVWLLALGLVAGGAFAANAVSAARPAAGNEVMTLWAIIASGGVSIVF